MFGRKVRELRQAGGLTQQALAARSGVSRQLVGAVEAGRHLPRVDAAAALAAALGTSVETLLTADEPPDAQPVLGDPPAVGTAVRLGRVGDRSVYTPAPLTWDGWALADGVVTDDGRVRPLDDAMPAAIVVGCDPAIALAARLVDEPRAGRLLAVPGSSAAAVTALAAGRAHAAVVHGPVGNVPEPPVAVRRWQLARWQVGLAASAQVRAGWWQAALTGRTPVIRREAGAGAQAAFERAAARTGAVPTAGPHVPGHLEAAWLATRVELPAVTIEPAARAAGLAFHALETHVTQLWIAQEWSDEPALRRLGEAVTSRAFARRLEAIGGYDLTDCGTPVTA